MTVQRGSTPAGRKAYVVLDWVNIDPPTRAAEGLNRINLVADEADSHQAEREVGDVARVVTRLLPEVAADGGG